MKSKIGFLFLIAVVVIVTMKFSASEKIDNVEHTFVESSTSTSNKTNHYSDIASVSSASSSSEITEIQHTSPVSSSSSINSLSGAKINAEPEIVNFLSQIDSVKIPKIILPTPQRDPYFDYKNSNPEQLKEKALLDDPYAAYLYAEYIVKSGVRTTTDTGSFAYSPDKDKRAAATHQAREFYIRAFRGGIVSAADTLSRLYIWGAFGGNKVESLAWRKISFAAGESERYDCLRNSETCVVKDFNNLNRREFFYPCLTSSGDRCLLKDYEKAMELAVMYADSFEYAIQNKVPLIQFY